MAEKDPRIERSKQHGLLDILAIAICAVICGADSWVYVEMFGKSKEEWFRSFLDLPNGIPSHDTFGDVFSRLDPDRFQECFMEWSQAVADLLPGEVVPLMALAAVSVPGLRTTKHPDAGTPVFEIVLDRGAGWRSRRTRGGCTRMSTCLTGRRNWAGMACLTTTPPR